MVTRTLTLLLLLTLSASAQTPRIPPPESVNRNGLVGRWIVPGFSAPNSNKPTKLYNSSTFMDNATATADVFLTTLANRFAVVFPGSNYYSIPDSTRLRVENDITVVCWARINNNTTLQLLVAKYGLPDSGWLLYINASGFALFDGRDSSGSYRSSGVSTTKVNDNKWHLLVGQRKEATWKIYTDSVLRSSANVGSTGSIAGATVDLNIGYFRLEAFSPLVGEIGDVRIYNRALTANEIANIYRGVQ
jgi:hypothetical protein